MAHGWQKQGTAATQCGVMEAPRAGMAARGGHKDGIGMKGGRRKGKGGAGGGRSVGWGIRTAWGRGMRGGYGPLAFRHRLHNLRRCQQYP